MELPDYYHIAYCIFLIYGFHFSSHTTPISHINPIYGDSMDFSEIRIFPLEKTMEIQRYVFCMEGNVLVL